MPRRSGFLVPDGAPRRGDLTAAAGVAVLLVHLLFAQLTGVLAVALYGLGRLTRWRPQWLAVPAAAGLIWSLAIGPGRAAAGFAAGPGQVAGYLAGIPGHPATLLHAAGAFAGLPSWLPRQLPLAAIAAAAEAAIAGWAQRRRLRSGDPAPYRPGLVVAARRGYTAAMLAAGGVVTSDGGCLGVDPATGRQVSVCWPEAERGVLVTGPDQAAVSESGLQLTWAAIRRRKAVIVIDLTGSASITAALTAACAAAGAPLRSFGAAGPGCYEPVRGGPPERTASLALAMIDWSAVTDARRRSCAAYLSDACAVLAAAPADPCLPVLDDLAGLLQPGALSARAARVPGYHPRREVLLDRAGVSASLLAADPAATSAAAQQLSRLRASALGHWLAPALAVSGSGGSGPAVPISLGQSLRERAVAAFALDRAVHGRSAGMIAALAAADLLAILAELQALAVRTDCLAWINGCEVLPPARLADLVRRGAQTGAAVVLTTTSAPAATALAGEVDVIVTRGRLDPALDRALDPALDTALGPALGPAAGPAPGWDAAVAVETGLGGGVPFRVKGSKWSPSDSAALTLLVRGPQGRFLPACRAVRPDAFSTGVGGTGGGGTGGGGTGGGGTGGGGRA